MDVELADKLKQAVTMIEKKGTAYAEAKGTSWNLQELRKVILSEQVRAQNPTLSVAEREHFARTTDEYKTHLKGTSEAIKKELIAKAEYERWTAQVEALRSLLSHEKARMNL